MAASAAAEIEGHLEAAAAVCARSGGRLTALRRSVLGLILSAEAPLTAYQLLDRLRATRKGAAPPTVYRALEFLLEKGLIHKVESRNAFVPCLEPGHHTHPVQFLICGKCGTVAELEDEAVVAALDRAALRHGFRLDTAVVELEGICAACATR
jgi:Fur family zinc uptake transcriptional regulator